MLNIQKLVLTTLLGFACHTWADGDFSTQRSLVLSEAGALNMSTKAKNVILFVGDGMGISTVTAARILEGQLMGGLGEENYLSFERFPNLALSKTYSVNQQTPDSAPTMTAMITGHKTNGGMLSVDASLDMKEQDWSRVRDKVLPTLFELAEVNGLSTGIVTSTRLTHATPGACYAHTPNRNWESDVDVPSTSNVPDIARQFVEFPFGDGIDVALGGGLSYFVPKDGSTVLNGVGIREDGRDLVNEWLERRGDACFVRTKTELGEATDLGFTKILGLFSDSHMPYEVDRRRTSLSHPILSGFGVDVPSLSEMTAAAIAALSRNEVGFLLHVEAGRIDHGHHASNAYRALHEVIELSRAVKVAVQSVNLSETLIIVTADHSHVFTIAGYPKRGNPILGKVTKPGADEPDRDLDGLPYTTLGYMNGPGSHSFEHGGDVVYEHDNRAGRRDLSGVNTESPGFHQESLVPLKSETHGGEDVAIYATGPGSILFRGVREQNFIFHVMAYALGIKDGILEQK